MPNKRKDSSVRLLLDSYKKHRQHITQYDHEHVAAAESYLDAHDSNRILQQRPRNNSTSFGNSSFEGN